MSNQSDLALDIQSIFWQQWQQYRDCLYRCCVKWMGGNPIDAEDALSRAMLKAWEKAQKFAGEIANFKAWLTTLTHNLCVDIHRERRRGANRVEDIESYASGEEQGLVAFENTPDCAVENSERRIVIRRAIDNLPTRLRETFILHFYQELSYPEIAQQQDVSYQNVCKRISQARKILQAELRGYFIGEEETDRDKSVPPTATESEIGEMFQENAGVEAGAGETVLSVAVGEVEIVGGEEAQEVAGDVQQSESVMVAATSEGKLEVLKLSEEGKQTKQMVALHNSKNSEVGWRNRLSSEDTIKTSSILRTGAFDERLLNLTSSRKKKNCGFQPRRRLFDLLIHLRSYKMTKFDEFKTWINQEARESLDPTKDWIFYECLANDPLYAKTDSEKKFILWEASGTDIDIKTIDGLEQSHKSLYDFFILENSENEKEVRFPFNSGDSICEHSLSPYSLVRQNITLTKVENYKVIPRWSTASRSSLALIPIIKKDLKDLSLLESVEKFYGSDSFRKADDNYLNSDELKNKAYNRFYQFIGKNLHNFCNDKGAEYKGIQYRLYSIKTGVSYVGSQNQSSAGKNLLEANSSLAILRSNAILKVFNKDEDTTFRLQVELLTVTAPIINEQEEDTVKQKVRDGFQVRDLSSSIKPNEIYLPAHAIPYSQNTFHPVPTENNNEEVKKDVEFWSKNFARICGMAKAKMFLMFGLIHISANAQNFVLAFDKKSVAPNNTPVLKGFILRDIGDTSWHDKYIEEVLYAKKEDKKEDKFEHIYNAFDQERQNQNNTKPYHLLEATSSTQYPAPYIVSLATPIVVSHRFENAMMSNRNWKQTNVLKFQEEIVWGFFDYISRALKIKDLDEIKSAEITTSILKSLQTLGKKLKYPGDIREDTRKKDLEDLRKTWGLNFLELAKAFRQNSDQWYEEHKNNEDTTGEWLINIQEAAICSFVDDYILDPTNRVTIVNALDNLPALF